MSRQAGVPRRLTVGIATRNRPDSLARCVASLAILGDLVSDIIVIDDSSDVPVLPVLETLPADLLKKLTFISQPDQQGPIVARNTMVRLADSEIVLLLDDDTLLVDDRGIRRALDLILTHPDVGAVACAMAHADGSPWPSSMQPSPATYLSLVPAYIGFAHLLRRDLFLKLGSYRPLFYFYGEEKDYCLRLINAGYHVVYDPEALVAHLVDPSGRSPARYLRYALGPLRVAPSPLRGTERLSVLAVQRAAAAHVPRDPDPALPVSENEPSRTRARSRWFPLDRQRAVQGPAGGHPRTEAGAVGERETLALAPARLSGLSPGVGVSGSKRRLLTIAHSYCVDLNRRLAQELAAAGDWEVTAVGPARFRGDFGWHTFEPRVGEACAAVPIPVHFSRRVHLMIYGRQLAALLREPWDLVHCWEEPYVASAAQVVWAARRETPVVLATFQNIAKQYLPPFSWIERYTMGRAAGIIASFRLLHEQWGLPALRLEPPPAPKPRSRKAG